MKDNNTVLSQPIRGNSGTFDYFVLGQGLCGTMLSYYLMQAGKTVLVIDAAQNNTATKIASGVINPVTGRRIVRTWRIEELLPFAMQAYTMLEQELDTKLVQQISILDFHSSHQMKEAFEESLIEETAYLHRPSNREQWDELFNSHFGAGEIAPCLLIDLNEMLAKWREVLRKNNSLWEEKIEWSECLITPNEVQINQFNAKKIICCEGVAGFTNPYFKNLPYSRMKGEALIASIPDLPRTHIYKQGINIVPWKKDSFWIGSTYEWDFKDLLPTTAWRKKAEEQLAYWLKVPFNIVDHFASERPANMERRPFVGLHPNYPEIGILNGMGAKGCSIAPFFARQLTDYLVYGTPIYADADVARFEKTLKRTLDS